MKIYKLLFIFLAFSNVVNCLDPIITDPSSQSNQEELIKEDILEKMIEESKAADEKAKELKKLLENQKKEFQEAINKINGNEPSSVRIENLVVNMSKICKNKLNEFINSCEKSINIYLDNYKKQIEEKKIALAIENQKLQNDVIETETSQDNITFILNYINENRTQIAVGTTLIAFVAYSIYAYQESSK